MYVLIMVSTTLSPLADNASPLEYQTYRLYFSYALYSIFTLSFGLKLVSMANTSFKWYLVEKKYSRYKKNWKQARIDKHEERMKVREQRKASNGCYTSGSSVGGNGRRSHQHTRHCTTIKVILGDRWT